MNHQELQAIEIMIEEVESPDKNPNLAISLKNQLKIIKIKQKLKVKIKNMVMMNRSSNQLKASNQESLKKH